MTVYCLAHGWMNHPALANGAYTKREAWCWLVEHAEGGKVVTSLRDLAEAWGPTPKKGTADETETVKLGEPRTWTKDRVTRFLDTLVAAGMVARQADPTGLVLTLTGESTPPAPVPAALPPLTDLDVTIPPPPPAPAPVDGLAKQIADRTNAHLAATGKPPVSEGDAMAAISDLVDAFAGNDKKARGVIERAMAKDAPYAFIRHMAQIVRQDRALRS